MVLICNNKLLTIEQWHKNRCMEKNQIKEILVKMKYDKDNDLEYKQEPVNILEIIGNISKNSQNMGVLPIKTKNYDCKN
jgi:hypothetical protein